MCDSRAPNNGADSAPEYVDPFDTVCDLCCRRIYDGSLRPEKHAGSTLWKCGKCRERAEQRYAESLPKDEVPEQATFDGWMEWAGLR